MGIEFTGERYLPEVGGGIELEHTHRYVLASSLAKDKVVLDIASGEGYGSNILSQSAKKVYGFDISSEAVAHARDRYQQANLEFNQGDCTAIPLPDAFVDLIVSFETIEHHDKHDEMMAEFARVLKPEGVLLISSPDRKEYSEVPGYDNPYHVKELTTDEFSTLLSQYFSSVKLYGQRVEYGSILGPIGGAPDDMRSFEATSTGYTETVGVSRPVYILALATNSPAGLNVSISSGTYSSPHIQQNAEIRDHLAAQVIRLEDEVRRLGEKASHFEGAVQQVLAERDEYLSQVASLAEEVRVLVSSRSWRMTRPLRGIVLVTKALLFDRSQLKPVLRRVFLRIPPRIRAGVKRLALTVLSPLMRRTGIYQRWRLEQVLATGTPKVRGLNGNRVLIIDRRYPEIDKDSGSVTTYSLIKTIRRLGYEVTFIPQDFADLPNYRRKLEEEGVECLHAGRFVGLSEYLEEFGSNFSLVILFRAHIAASYLPAVRHFCPDAKVVFHTMDLHFVREERQAELEGSQELKRAAEDTKNFELELIRQSDVAVVVSHYERQLLCDTYQLENVNYLPVSFIDVVGSSRSFSERHDIAFVGGYEHQPNVDAVEYFCESIWPSVRESMPEARFRIVGSNVTPAIEKLATIPGVTVVGWVEDLRSELSTVRLTVAPLRFGAGVKGKVVHSMAAGVPCVASPVAVEGMGLADGREVLLAETPEDFAAKIVKLYSDSSLWNQLSGAGEGFCRANFSHSIGEGKVAAMFLQLGLMPSDAEDFVRWHAATYSDYQQYIGQESDALLLRKTIDKSASSVDASGRSYPGYCRVCEQSSEFWVDMEYQLQSSEGGAIANLRERLVCSKCELNNRMRLSIDALNLLAKPTESSRIYITEQITPLYRALKSRLPTLVGSEYLDASIPNGESDENGIRNESLLALSFPDRSFDCVLSFDVLEHVPDYRTALEECYRVLDRGGRLIVSVPFFLDSKENILRATFDENGSVEHILAPEYHGDPLSDTGILSFHDFGWELLDDLRSVGFDDVKVHFFWSRKYAYLGADQFLICAQKPFENMGARK